jgi:hypothetical protein
MTCHHFAVIVRDALQERAEAGEVDVLRDALLASNAVTLTERGNVYPAMGIAARLAHKYSLAEAFASSGGGS